MIATADFRSTPESLHTRFLALLPRIERHGQVFFRHVKCPARKADYIAEMVALCWKWIIRLAEQGKDGFCFPMALARYAAWAVKGGRQVSSQVKAGDVMNPVAQQRYGFTIESLPISTRVDREHQYGAVAGQRLTDECEERLRDNTQTPVPEQAVFRIDFPAWLSTLTGRERRLIRAMVRNERTKDLAHRFELSPARVSQLRRQFHEGWRRFCDQP
jgi:hypothetical protein